jgi:competence protein ComEA
MLIFYRGREAPMNGLRKYWGLLAVALAALASLLGAALLFGAPAGAPRNATLVLPAAAPPAVSPQAQFSVYLTGAVRQPGVYSIPAGSRLQDLLAAAGGASETADLESVNLAARLQDEEHVVIPARAATPAAPVGGGPGVAAPGATAPPATAPGGAKININTADATALASLPGIGPALAARIVEYRTLHGRFASPAKLQDVPGIGAKLYELIASQIVAGP